MATRKKEFIYKGHKVVLWLYQRKDTDVPAFNVGIKIYGGSQKLKLPWTYTNEKAAFDAGEEAAKKLIR